MFPNKWNEKEYWKFLKYLESLKNQEYRDFHSKLCNTKYEILGINLPVVRKIAKEILKTDYEGFLQNVENKYYEETMIEGLVIASIIEEEKFFKYFNNFIYKIDNWGITDSVCNSLQILKKDRDKYFDYFKTLCLKEKEFVSRVGLIVILNFYIEKKYISKIFRILNQIKSDKYYVNMAQAWLICELYIFYPQETEKFLEKNKLNKFTQNKAISKIRESYRVSKEGKDRLNKLKR